MTTVCASRNTFKYKKQGLTYFVWKYLNEELEFMECLSNSLFLLINCELISNFFMLNMTLPNTPRAHDGHALVD